MSANKSHHFVGISAPLWGCFVLLSTFVLGCNLNKTSIENAPVIKVYDSKLSLKEFSDRLAFQLKDLDALTAKDPGILLQKKNRILQDFIIESLFLNFADKNKIEVTKSELEERIRKERSGFPDDTSFRGSLAASGISYIEWESRLRKELITHKIFSLINKGQSAISPAEIESYFKSHLDRFKRKERVYIRQIVVDDYTKAQGILELLKKSDFATTAKKVSVSPEKINGGLVGWVEKGSVDIFDKAFSMQVGAVSQALESQYGFHIIKVERRAAAGTAALEEVRDVIKSEIQAQREQALFTKWLDEQVGSAKVFKDQKLIDSLVIETKGASQ